MNEDKIQALCFLEWCLLQTVWIKSDFIGIIVDKRVCSYDDKCSGYTLPFLLIILGAAVWIKHADVSSSVTIVCQLVYW